MAIPIYSTEVLVDIILNIISNSVFWNAIEAITTLGTFVLIIAQIPFIRRQMAKHNIEGLKFMDEQLADEQFVRGKGKMDKKWKEQVAEFPDDIYPEMIDVFSRLNSIQIMLESNLVDKKFFMELYALGIYEINQPVTYFRHLENSKMLNIIAVFPKANQLIVDCTAFSWKKTHSSFRLLEKIQRRFIKQTN